MACPLVPPAAAHGVAVIGGLQAPLVLPRCKGPALGAPVNSWIALTLAAFAIVLCRCSPRVLPGRCGITGGGLAGGAFAPTMLSAVLSSSDHCAGDAAGR